MKNIMNLSTTILGLISIVSCKTTEPSVVLTQQHRVALKVEKGDPSKSFWSEQVQYAFPVKYKEAKDDKGHNWKIAYMDEYYGKTENPKVLVLIHGKGANAGYFSHLMGIALKNNIRVIAVDLPHYGKSIPYNLNNTLARTMDDARTIVHDIIVNQLKVDKATYLGHSLGGQFVNGYAVKWPQNVEKIILESSSGLEEYYTNLKIGNNSFNLFDPSYMDNFEDWKKAWEPLGFLKLEFAKNEEMIRLSYYFKQKDKLGNIIPASTGYFINDSEDARFLTETRVQMMTSNKKEYDNYITTYIRDIYAISVETRIEDSHSLYKKLSSITAPIFAAFGEKEPYIPVTAWSGRKSLKADVIKPFVNELKKAHNEPIVKVYNNVGHFIHTDIPDEFANDCVTFIINNKVNANLSADQI